MREVLLLTALCLAAGTGLAAQVEGEPAGVCANCSGRGELDCPRHGDLLAQEKSARFCSHAAECSQCEGALTIDCPDCVDEAVARAVQQRKLRARSWLHGRREEVAGRADKIAFLEQGEIALAFAARRVQIDGRGLDSHELAHLYLQRILALRTDFMKLFALGEDDFPAERAPTTSGAAGGRAAEQATSPRLEIFLFENRSSFRSTARRITRLEPQGVGVKLMGPTIAYCLYHDASLLDDAELFRHLVHNTAHLLWSNLRPSGWLGLRHGWLDAGVAHYFEYRAGSGDVCTSACYSEHSLAPTVTFRRGNWREAVRRLVDQSKQRPFAELGAKATEDLDFVDHALAFAWVEFLIDRGGGPQLAKLRRMLVEGRPLTEAIEELYPSRQESLDEAFSRWVRAKY